MAIPWNSGLTDPPIEMPTMNCRGTRYVVNMYLYALHSTYYMQRELDVPLEASR